MTRGLAAARKAVAEAVPKTLAEADALIPSMLSSMYGGAWVGWYVRALLTPFIGYKDAQYVVARALGPGFDYEAPHYHEATVTVTRGKRKKGERAEWRSTY